MSTFKFVGANTASHSGGITVGFLYDNLVGTTTSIPPGTTELDFTGNATGTGYVIGIVGGDGNDILTGLDGNDVFTGGKGNDTITGGIGNDQLFGGLGANTIDGGAGSDIASADFSDQTGDVVAVNGGVAGIKYSFTVGGSAFGSVINVEMMTGLVGGTGNDRLGGVYSLASRDSAITGGLGTDTAVIDLSADLSGGLSGGFNVGFIYNNNTGRSLTLTGLEVLEYIGNATGTSYTTGIVAGDGNDILIGLDGNDVFTGGKGDDTITGKGGNDQLYGGLGANTIDGGTGYDIATADFSDQSGNVLAINGGVTGKTYSFTVAGKAYGSVTDIEMMTGLTGGKGNDRLGGVYTLASQNSAIAGGAGTDTAVVDLSAEPSGGLSGGFAVGFIYNNNTGRQLFLTDMEVLEYTGNATGTSYTTGIVGGDGNDILTGLDGNDVFTGGKGNDTITGGKGDDALYGGAGANTIEGGAGYDIASTDFSDQTGAVVALNLGVADTKYDFTVGGAKFGSVRNIEMMSGLTGGAGGDRLGGVYTLTKQTSTISGGAGTDTAVVDLSADTKNSFSGGIGANKFIYSNSVGYFLNLNDIEVLEFTGNATGSSYNVGIVGAAGNDILTGLAGNDVFNGAGGNDKISGAAGNDSLAGGNGANTIDGGADYDVASADFSDQTGDVVALAFGVGGIKYDFTVGGKAHGSVVNVEMMTGLTGGKGNDRLGGAYILTGQHSTISGGDGTDTAVVDLSADTKGGFSGGLGAKQIYNNATGYNVYLNDMEVLEFTGNAVNGSYASGIVGGDFNDILTGLDGNDIFTGGKGDDKITGGKGDDALYGGTGANAIEGGAGYDIASADFSDQSGTVVALNLAAADTTYDFTVGGAKYGFVRNVEMMTGLTGGTGDDRLGGVYTLTSRSAAITGGAGTDTAVVDLAADTGGKFSGGLAAGIIYNNVSGYSISLTGMEVLEFTGNAVNGSYNNGIVGGAGADILTGLGGNDTFTGQGGNDIITGAAGNDILSGGTGANTIDGGANYDTADADFSDQTGDVVAVNGGVAGVVYQFTVGGKAHGSVTNIEMMTGLTGGAGNDRLGGAYLLTSQNSSITGGAGTDTAVVDLSADINSNFSGGIGAGIIYNNTAGYFLTLNTMEVLEFTGNAVNGSYANGIVGGGAADILTGLGKADIFRGGDGNDRLRGNGGDDQLFGDAGDDTAVFAGTFASYSFKFNKSSVEVTGADGVDTLTSIEFLEFDDGAVEIGGGGFVTSTIAIAAATVTKAEGTGGTTPFVFTLSRTGGTKLAQTVGYTVAGAAGSGTVLATAADFAGGAFPSGNVTFAAGSTTATLTVNVAADAAAELNERFAVTLVNPQIGVTLGNASAQGVIINDDSAFSIAALAASKAEGTGGTTPFTFTVTRSGLTPAGQSVAWAVTGAAGAGTQPADATDFDGGVLPSGTLVFNAGETSRVLTVQVAADALGEADDRFAVTLSGPSAGATVTGVPAQGVIVNDDAPSLAISADGNVDEGQAGTTLATFTVTRSGLTTGSTTVNWAVTGSGGAAADAADFVGGVLPGGSITFAPGETSRTITVAVAGDTAVEGNEDFRVTLSAPTGGAVLATAAADLTIDNDDALIAITPLSAVKAEGTGGVTPYTFTVARTGDLSVGHSVSWSVAGAAGSGTVPAGAADFAGGVFPGGTISFAAGETSKVLTVSVLADAVGELNERFAVTLSAPSSGATIGGVSAHGVILNDDTSVAISPALVSALEGTAGATPFVFIVSRAGTLAGASSVNWTVAGTGGAPADAADFAGGVLPGGTVNFAAGESSKTVTVNVAGDSVVESNEGFTVTLSGAVGAAISTGSAAGTILSDDATIAIAPLSASKLEGTGGTTPFTFTLTRTGGTAVAQSVTWSAAGIAGSGTLPSNAADFAGGVLPTGSVTFAVGETRKILTVAVAADVTGEANERFAVTRPPPPAGAVLGPATAGAVIFNDDTSLAISPASQSKAEGNSGGTAVVFTVSRAGSILGTTTVDWSFAGGGVAGTGAPSASDFVGGVLPAGGTLTFAHGQSVSTITVNVAGDTAPELNESFTITLSNPAAGVALTAAAATAVVTDDDTIYGTTGNDALVGTSGADLFVIGSGVDSITGGLGTDTFRFIAAALGDASVDAFTFEDLNRAAGEKFDLSQIDAIAGTVANDAFSFIGTAAFNGTAGQLRWEDQGTVRLIQGNVNADTTADLTIFVKAAGPVDAAWFTL